MEKIKCIVFLFMSFCFATITSGQEKVIFEQIQQKRAQKSFIEKSNVFTLVPFKRSISASHFKAQDAVTFLRYDATQILTTNDKEITIHIPIKKQKLILDLVEVPTTFYEYSIVTNSGKLYKANRANKHYRGIIRGNSQSLVAISFFKNEVIGVISNQEGNFSIGKSEQENIHAIYKDTNLKKSRRFFCATKDNFDFKGYSKQILFPGRAVKTTSNEVLARKQIALYFETEHDIYLAKSSNVRNVEDYVTALYNQVATIYQNERINTKISQIQVWTTPDPYTATELGQIKDQFQNHTNSLNGDLGQLLTFRQVGGGVAAGFNGLCSGNVDDSLSVSGSLSSNVVSFPSYSLNVELVAHEFGHLFGSRHTHACVWNGNNTAIDGCWAPEGNCSRPPLPAQGGTIMSYCALASVGMNFSLGFGPQPGNVIRSHVVNCCTKDVVISNSSTSNSDVQTSEKTITASNTVAASKSAVYTANTRVRLIPGFRALLNSSFRAAIASCVNGPVDNSGGEDEDDVGFSSSSKHQIQLYPNPIKDILFIKIPHQMHTENSRLQIFNSIGKLVYSINNIPKEVNISKLKTGIYFIKINNETTTYLQQKIVKQ